MSDDCKRVDELRPGDKISYRNGGSAVVTNVSHFIGAGIGHQLDLSTDITKRRYECTGKCLTSGCRDLDVIDIEYVQNEEWVFLKKCIEEGKLPECVKLPDMVDYDRMRKLEKRIKELEEQPNRVEGE